MELLERDGCLADLAEWRVAALEHGGSVVLVGGEAGIGKTALLREFCARQRHMRVLWGDASGWNDHQRGLLGHLRIRRGDPDASAPLDEARELAGPEPELQRLGTLAAIRAEAAWLAGDHQGVVRQVTPAYERLSQRADPRMKGELAVWLCRATALQGAPTGIAEPYATEIAGNWRDAARAWQSLGCPYEQAIVLGWYGGESEQREALAIFTRLGAAPAADSLRRQMRAGGIRGIPSGAHSSTQQNPYGLTRREAQILALMRDGLRNAAIARYLFLSTRTVDHHVSAVLAKLGATSRTQAVEIARRQPEAAEH